MSKPLRIILLLCSIILASPPGISVGQQRQELPPAAPRDGSRDFDFEIGEWTTHLKRLQRPLSGSTTWVEYKGTSTVRGVLTGRANLVELVVEGPAGRIEGASCVSTIHSPANGRSTSSTPQMVA